MDSPTFNIIDQPAAYGTRFRYVSEGTCHGPILGQSSTPGNRTHPAVKCSGNFHDGQEAILLVSIVSDEPKDAISYGMHGHTFFGPRNVFNGQYIVEIQASSGTFDHQLQGVTIIHTKGADKNDVLSGKYIQDVLLQKEGIQNYKRLMETFNKTSTTDQLNLGWFYDNFPEYVSDSKYEAAHVQYLANQVRLKFDIFIKDHYIQTYNNPPLTVLSQVVHNTRDREHKPLHIQRASRSSGSPVGNEEIFLFCDEFISKDLEVYFYHGMFPGEYIGKGTFSTTDIHNKCGLVFKTPPLARSISAPFLSNYCLKRSEMISNSFEFTYNPLQDRFIFPDNTEMYPSTQSATRLKPFDLRSNMPMDFLPNSLAFPQSFNEHRNDPYVNPSRLQENMMAMDDFNQENTQNTSNLPQKVQYSPLNQAPFYHNYPQPYQTQLNAESLLNPYPNSPSNYSQNSSSNLPTHALNPEKSNNQQLIQHSYPPNPQLYQAEPPNYHQQNMTNIQNRGSNIAHCDPNYPPVPFANTQTFSPNTYGNSDINLQ